MAGMLNSIIKINNDLIYIPLLKIRLQSASQLKGIKDKTGPLSKAERSVKYNSSKFIITLRLCKVN